MNIFYIVEYRGVSVHVLAPGLKVVEEKEKDQHDKTTYNN
jgi:hypothetical protein